MDVQRVIEQLKRHEGLRLTVYDDATGKPIAKRRHITGQSHHRRGSLANRGPRANHNRSGDAARE